MDKNMSKMIKKIYIYIRFSENKDQFGALRGSQS